jgi:hypothetical protein
MVIVRGGFPSFKRREPLCGVAWLGPGAGWFDAGYGVCTGGVAAELFSSFFYTFWVLSSSLVIMLAFLIFFIFNYY